MRKSLIAPLAVALAATAATGTHQPPTTQTADRYTDAPKWDDLHPALRVDGYTAALLFNRGKRDAEKLKDHTFLNADFQRGIGSVRRTSFAHETVSYINLRWVAVAAYIQGFNCRKTYLPDDETARDRERFAAIAGMSDTVVFTGILRICPSFGSHGRVVRRANPDDLRDVRVVLKVGDRIYQPEEQPGTLAAGTETGENVVEVPARSSTTVYNSAGQAVASARSYYSTEVIEGYRWYTGHFAVEFRVFDKDGSARITSQDKDLEAIVMYGPNERHATFSLEAMKRFVDERSKP